jgi:hypothetical protein
MSWSSYGADEPEDAPEDDPEDPREDYGSPNVIEIAGHRGFGSNWVDGMIPHGPAPRTREESRRERRRRKKERKRT